MKLLIFLTIIVSVFCGDIPLPDQCCSCNECPALQRTVKLIGGQHYEFGDVSLVLEHLPELNSINAYATIEWNQETCPFHELKDVHFYIGFNEPINKFGQWTCKWEYPNNNSFMCQYQYNETDMSCNNTVHIGFHTSLCCDVSLRNSQCETAFAIGNTKIPDHNWGTYNTFELCCDNESKIPRNNSCTYTQGFWKNHNKYEDKNRYIEWPIDEDTVLCNNTLLEWLYIEPKGNSWIRLVHQWIAAMLNVYNGANSTVIDECLYNISINNCTEGNNYCHDLFTQFNEGIIGPGHCDDIITYYNDCGSDGCICLTENTESPDISSNKLVRVNNNVDKNNLESNCKMSIDSYKNYYEITFINDDDEKLCYIANDQSSEKSIGNKLTSIII